MLIIYKAYRKSLEIRDKFFLKIKKAKRKITSHINGPFFNKKKKFLIIGHPRCGTGYMANLLQKYGYDIGHEIMKKDGISSWTYAVLNENPCIIWLPDYYHYNRSDFNFNYIIHVVRNPFDAIPSILYTEDIHPESLDFRKKHIEITKSNLEGAIQSYILWNRMIEKQQPDIRVRVENADENLHVFFNKYKIRHKKLTENKQAIKKKINTREHAVVPNKSYHNLSEKIKNDLKKITKDYGYEIPSWFN